VSAEAERPDPLLWLDDIAEEERSRVGAKAWALARLRRAGLPVPDGFVLPADAGEPDLADLEAACARLGAVAVRSSAWAEDTAEASFAGQYRTELDVRGAKAVLAALHRCRSAEATPYAAAMGTAAAATGPIPVLVQRFVEPRWAGVVFTRDPGDPGVLLVESHPGRGEALVSGAVTPRRHAIDRETGRPRAGSRVADVPDDDLPAADLVRLVTLARRAEELFAGP